MVREYRCLASARLHHQPRPQRGPQPLNLAQKLGDAGQRDLGGEGEVPHPPGMRRPEPTIGTGLWRPPGRRSRAMDAITAHRIHFAFTATYHYLFPPLTMGLALLIVILKSAALRSGEAHYDRAARFWGRIFAINFAMGVVTGVPLEFQFGTNWARFSRAAGGIIGQTLAMEGVFAFFLESSFLGLFLFGERRL